MILQRFVRFSKIILLTGVVGFACSESPRFERVDPDDSGVKFINHVKATPELNIFNYLYFYNGGGVGAGDLNGDSLVDLVFTSNQGQNRFYLNQSDFKFKDVSERLETEERSNKWSTGVSLADVNGDGRLDIYICEVGKYQMIEGRNKLYINLGNDENGIPEFSEQAAKYRLDLIGFSTQAAFFDYDLDNDLDMYMLNHSVHSNGTFGRVSIRNESHPLAGDRFFRNDNGVFNDVTNEVGIYDSPLGYGLGIGVSDINSDRYPDVYIGNDFHEDDYFYINNGDGTFTESLGDMINHTSRFSMGNDLADINNDGLIDILTLDMLPREYEMLKTSAGEDAYDVYQYKLKQGYKDQFARNALQLNRGNGKFSEIGLMAGVAATDWSWSGFFADFDLDGWNDLFIANGIVGRTNDLDYIRFISNDAIQFRLEGKLTERELLLSEKMPVVEIPNYAFKNTGNLTFLDVSKEWGLDHRSFSNGAVYADLDNDGDLDIITNNINSEALVYRNSTMEKEPGGKFLSVRFKGPQGNSFGVGAKLNVRLPDGTELVRELFPVRGYQSCVPHELHIGLDTSVTALENVKIIWPDGKQQVIAQVRLNQKLNVYYSDAKAPVHETGVITNSYFRNVTEKTGIDYKHEENQFLEFNREALIPGMISALGPALAKADVNGDGLDDFFIGGAKNEPSYLFFQNQNGTFTKDSLREDPKYEDVDAAFIDYDRDGDPDLLVASGGNEFWGKSEFLNPRIYKNENGSFERDEAQLKEVFINASRLAVADFDQDGDSDVFIGERAIPWNYGLDPKSLLLVNDGRDFKVDEKLIDGKQLGMVTDAKWADLDQDGTLDLIVASEWSTIKVLYQKDGTFDIQKLPSSEGLWVCFEVGDMDNNGHLDIIGGNLGLNSKLAVSGDAKIKMYVNDFDDNEQVEQIITIFRDGEELFFADKDDLTKQLNFIKKKYMDYKSFARASLDDVLSKNKLVGARRYEVSDTRSAIFYQTSRGTFERQPLPIAGQMAPVYEILVNDFNFDSMDDLLLGGNFTRTTVQRGKYDASMGELFLQKSHKELEYVSQERHGLYLSGEVRHVVVLNTKEMPILLVVRNNGPIEVYAFQ